MRALATRYRAQATRIRWLADYLHDPLERARFFDFATEYDKLACYAEQQSGNRIPVMLEGTIDSPAKNSGGS